MSTTTQTTARRSQAGSTTSVGTSQERSRSAGGAKNGFFGQIMTNTENLMDEVTAHFKKITKR